MSHYFQNCKSEGNISLFVAVGLFGKKKTGGLLSIFFYVNSMQIKIDLVPFVYSFFGCIFTFLPFLLWNKKLVF